MSNTANDRFANVIAELRHMDTAFRNNGDLAVDAMIQLSESAGKMAVAMQNMKQTNAHIRAMSQRRRSSHEHNRK